MDSRNDKDYFQLYLDNFPTAPSLVIVRSVEAKNFPYGYIKGPILDLCCGDGFFGQVIGLDKYYTIACDINDYGLKIANNRKIYKDIKLEDARKLTSFSR